MPIPDLDRITALSEVKARLVAAHEKRLVEKKDVFELHREVVESPFPPPKDLVVQAAEALKIHYRFRLAITWNEALLHASRQLVSNPVSDYAECRLDNFQIDETIAFTPAFLANPDVLAQTKREVALEGVDEILLAIEKGDPKLAAVSRFPELLLNMRVAQVPPLSDRLVLVETSIPGIHLGMSKDPAAIEERQFVVHQLDPFHTLRN